MSDSHTMNYVIIIIILVLISGFFSSTETAFSSVNKIRLRNYLKNGNKKAKKALNIIENYDNALSAILIGNNIVNIASASISTVLFTKFFGDAGIAISTIIITILVLIFGEIIPKSIAKEHPESFTLATSSILSVIMVVLYPFIKVFVGLKNIFVKIFINKSDSQPSVTEQELKFIIQEIKEEGVLEEQEGELVQSALDFDEITVGEIFTPRVDIIAIDYDLSTENILSLFIKEKYSRIPVYKNTIDNIIGVLHERDFFTKYIKEKTVDIKSILQKTIYLPQQKKISEALKELQKQKLHMAVISDHYGGTLGIVTLEDILEELVGEIWDEADEVELDIIEISEKIFQVNGDMNIYDMIEKLCENISDFFTTSNTVSGWVLEKFEKIPNQGDFFEFKNIKVTVKTVEEQRVIDLIIEII